MDWIDQLEKEIAESELLIRKLERRGMCVKNVPMFFYDKEALLRGRYYCRDWRECPVCFRIRTDSIKDRVLRAQTQGYQVYVEFITEAEAKKVVRKLGKSEYLRIPQPNGMVKMFIRCALSDIEVDNVDVNSIDWDVLVRAMPLKKSISGSLGKMPKKVYEQSVTVPAIIIQDIDEVKIYELDVLARATTAHLKPTNPDELLEKILMQHEELVRLVIDAGGRVIEAGGRMVECHFSSIKNDLIDRESHKMGLSELESIFGVG